MINKGPQRSLAVTAALLAAGLLATACSSNSSTTGGGSGSASASSTTSGSTTSLSNVTLNIGDQAGSGSEALLTAAGLINKMPFKVHWSDRSEERRVGKECVP